MSSIEHHNDDWKEMRSRTDSIANVVFLIGGGSLSLSISVILGNMENLEITIEAFHRIQNAWLSLFGSIVLALFLKIFMVFQSFHLQINTSFMNDHHGKFNFSGWIIGLTSFALFCIGLYLMIASGASLVAQNLHS